MRLVWGSNVLLNSVRIHCISHTFLIRTLCQVPVQWLLLSIEMVSLSFFFSLCNLFLCHAHKRLWRWMGMVCLWYAENIKVRLLSWRPPIWAKSNLSHRFPEMEWIFIFHSQLFIPNLGHHSTSSSLRIIESTTSQKICWLKPKGYSHTYASVLFLMKKANETLTSK